MRLLLFEAHCRRDPFQLKRCARLRHYLTVEGDGGIPMKVLTDFAGQNWLITPAALAVGENPPASIHEQRFLLVLSGVVIANLEGNSGSQWLHETLSFLPDMAGPQGSGPLNWAISRYGIPKPAGQNFTIGFSLEEWAPFASLSSIFDQDQSINCRLCRRCLASHSLWHRNRCAARTCRSATSSPGSMSM